jgi:hypothetical protein
MDRHPGPGASPDAHVATRGVVTPETGAPYRTAAAPVRYRIGPREPSERWPPRARLVGLILTALVIWTMAIAWREHRLKVEIAGLPEPARHALYSHALDELRSVCNLQAGLRAHCRDEADLILKLPECDVDCRAVAAQFLVEHTRR